MTKRKGKNEKKIMIFLCRKHDQPILLSILPISKLTWPPKKFDIKKNYLLNPISKT